VVVSFQTSSGMGPSAVGARATSLNARVGGVALAVSAFLTLLLSHVAASLAPLRLLALAASAFAAWCFCDEMGMRKPLNRAGFVFFVIAVAAKVQLILGVAAGAAGRYDLLHAAFLLVALLFWSVAFLHRGRALKVVGAVGVVASVAPIVALIAGHLAVGAGALLGVRAMLAAADGSNLGDHSFATLVDRLFGLWGYVAAWLLWRGHVQAPAAPAVKP
jgi:hypothetical protein